ncbi:MAG: hypothetical protein IJS27_02585 [Ruminococcus sp.]|nr:hypothetical protein [Ruminococcus sp.]
MNTIEETEVKVTDPVTEAEVEGKPSMAARWIEEDTPEQPEKPKKKGPFIQVPVIISLCLVVVSLLAFFAYKIFWIAEPEGVTWVWSSETDNVKWYFEFKDDNIFKAHIGSFEVTSNYVKDKSDDSVSKMTVSADVPFIRSQSLGCIFFGAEMKYNVTGSRIAGNQEMTITYTDDPEQQEFVLTQTNEKEEPLELPDDFTEDKDLTGEWINIYSTDDAKQTMTFNDDGSMVLSEVYTFSNGNLTEIRRNCTYTIFDNEINITWRAEDTVVHSADYVIKDGMLTLDGATYYRADSAATPDQSK